MVVKVVNLRDFANELEDFTDKHIDKLQATVASGLAKSIPLAVAESPVDTGQYASSWDFSVEEKSAFFGNFAPHAPIIERGARPFTPPIGPLLAWAKRVLKDPSQPPNYSKRVWALAKGTQNKIAAEGIQPRHVMEKLIPKIIANIKSEMERIK